MRTLLITSICLASIAGLDAVRGDHWDQFAMLGVLAGLSVVGLVLHERQRSAVRLRPELLAWLEDHAARTDDEPRRVVDRAMAAYRAQLLPDPDDGAEES